MVFALNVFNEAASAFLKPRAESRRCQTANYFDNVCFLHVALERQITQAGEAEGL